MGVIQNFDSLATSPLRTTALDLVETAFAAISPKQVMDSEFKMQDSKLLIKEKTYDLSHTERVFVIGFGKGSSGVCRDIEAVLGSRLTYGWDIDVVDEVFQKIVYTKGTHPLPSETNIAFTQNVLDSLTQLHLSEKDLVLVVICGGGSALFEAPFSLSLPRLAAVNSELLKSGATISEMNVIRKHLSKVKGGGLAKYLYPAAVASLLFSDVPGNDMAVIASGPTVKNTTTMRDVDGIVAKYQLKSVVMTDFTDTISDTKYFNNVQNIMMVSNQTALVAMQQKAKELGKRVVVLTDRLQGDAKKIGKLLLSETRQKEILLAGGETTIHVTGTGKGGRNQSLVLAALHYLEDNEVIVAFDSDGWDFTTFAGAIGDKATLEKAESMGLDLKLFLDNDNSTEFFEKVGDGILTGKLESNVSDLYIVIKD